MGAQSAPLKRDAPGLKDDPLRLPKTFEERGAVVPFTTPLLAQTRVRFDDPGRPVLVMPGLAGGGTYVVSWDAVPDLANLTVHDRALHDELRLLPVCTPSRVRRTALRIAATGLAGTGVADAARRAHAEDEREAMSVHAVLAVSFLRAAGVSSRAVMAGEGGRPASLRTELAGAAARFGLAPEAMMLRLRELAVVLAAIGIAWPPGRPGRLRLLAGRLPGTEVSIRRWADTDRTAASEFGRAAAHVAGFSGRLAGLALAEIDDGLSDLKALLGDWDAAFGRIRRAAARVHWLLDGWDFVVGSWDHHSDLPGQHRRDALMQICRVLPLPPADEIAENAALAMRRDVFPRLRQVEDWRGGRHELELVARHEAIRERVLRPLPPPEPEAARGTPGEPT